MTARKIMLLGEIGVGKSSLARRLCFDKFDFDYKPTIGVDIYRFEVPDGPGRERMSLIIWDTDGNFGDTIFKHIYMKEAAGALIIGDFSRPETLDTMASLGVGFSEAFPGRHTGYIVNKSDLIAEAAPLPASIARAGTSIIRTSAKTGSNVTRAFIETAEVLARRGL